MCVESEELVRFTETKRKYTNFSWSKQASDEPSKSLYNKYINKEIESENWANPCYIYRFRLRLWRHVSELVISAGEFESGMMTQHAYAASAWHISSYFLQPPRVSYETQTTTSHYLRSLITLFSLTYTRRAKWFTHFNQHDLTDKTKACN